MAEKHNQLEEHGKMSFDIEGQMAALTRRQITRGQFIKAGLAAGLSMTTVGTLLAACGSSVASASNVPAAAFVGGDGSLGKVLKDGFRVGTYIGAPYVIQTGSGRLTGIDGDIFYEVASRLNLADKVKLTIGQWDSMIPALHVGRIDFIMADFHETPERETQVDFTGPMFWYGDELAVQKGNPLNLHTWESLAGHTVGALRGESYVDYLNKRHDLKEVKTYTDFNTEIIDLEAGRVDALIEESPVLSYYMAQHPNANIERATGYLPQDPLGDWTRWGTHTGAHDLNNAITRITGDMQHDGTMWQILKKYGMPASSLQVFAGMPNDLT